MAETYRLKLLVDDTQVRALEARLGKMMGMTGASMKGGSTTEASGGGGIMGMAKNITKLAAMVIPVLAIRDMMKKMQSLMVESSPMLQAMLKLFQTSLLLIFRPIGDFVGFLLRPIMMVLLTQIALPFYRRFAPIMQQWGTMIGTRLATFLQTHIPRIMNLVPKLLEAAEKLIPFLLNPATALAGVVDNLISGLTGGASEVIGEIGGTITGSAQESWNTITEWFQTQADAIGTALGTPWNNITQWFQNAANGIGAGLGTAWNNISNWFVTQGNAINTALWPAWNKVINFFASISNGAAGALTTAWNAVTNWFTSQGDAINEALWPAWNNIVLFFSSVSNLASGALQTAWDTIVSVFQAIANAIQNIAGWFGITLGSNRNSAGQSVQQQSVQQLQGGGTPVNINIDSRGGISGTNDRDWVADLIQNILRSLGR